MEGESLKGHIGKAHDQTDDVVGHAGQYHGPDEELFDFGIIFINPFTVFLIGFGLDHGVDKIGAEETRQ